MEKWPRNIQIMSSLKHTDKSLWKGRNDPQNGEPNYWHEMVRCMTIEELPVAFQHQLAFVGYACDEGVKRNQGRAGAFDGPDSLRKLLAVLPNHFKSIDWFYDLGNIECENGDLSKAQNDLAATVKQVLKRKTFPILLGGGHDIAYAHYSGIRQYLNIESRGSVLGVINLDAHFDLRSNASGNTSGTPFYQIAMDCQARKEVFHYCCLGIQKAANTRGLYKTAKALGVDYLESEHLTLANWDSIENLLNRFLSKVDHVYLTIDLDGFSSAYAPGVSAPSALGFTPDVAFKIAKHLCQSKKLISVDLAELNPKYDQDNSAARLGARLVHYLVDGLGF